MKLNSSYYTLFSLFPFKRNETISNSSRKSWQIVRPIPKSPSISRNCWKSSHRIPSLAIHCHAWREIREIFVALFRMPRSDRKRIRITLDRRSPRLLLTPSTGWSSVRLSFPWNSRIPVVYRCTTSFMHIRRPDIHACSGGVFYRFDCSPITQVNVLRPLSGNRRDLRAPRL